MRPSGATTWRWSVTCCTGVNQAKAPPLHRYVSQLQLAVRVTTPGLTSWGCTRARCRSADWLRSRCGIDAQRRAVCPQLYEARKTPGAADTLGSRAVALSLGYQVVPVGRSVKVPPP